MKKSTPEQLSQLISSDTLENLSFLELIEVSQTNPNKEIRARAISLINNFDRNDRYKNIVGFMDYIKAKHDNRFYKLHNSITSVIELKQLRLQCIDTANIITNTPLNFGLVEELKEPFKLFTIEYLERNSNLLNNINEKISYRLEKAELAKSLPKKLDSLIGTFQEKFNSKLWECKDVATLIKVFNFENTNREKFRVIDRGLFYFFLHRLYDTLQYNTAKEHFYKNFLLTYELSYNSFKDKANLKNTKKEDIRREILRMMPINDN